MKKATFLISIICLLLAFNFLFPDYMNAELLERIVAIVNDDVILHSEFSKALEIAREYDTDVIDSDVLDEMIDRLLILKEARKFRLTSSANEEGKAKDDMVIIKEYIDVRLRGFIHVPYEDVEYYYYQNRDSYSGKDFFDVRNEIEEYLIEQELNIKLLEYIEDLKRNAYIRIQMGTDS
jgi:hypothetical protein